MNLRKRAAIAAALGVLSSTPDLAADKFVPFSIDEATFNAWRAYLAEQPHKFAGPLDNDLIAFENRAREEAKKVEAAKTEAAKPPAEGDKK